MGPQLVERGNDVFERRRGERAAAAELLFPEETPVREAALPADRHRRDERRVAVRCFAEVLRGAYCDEFVRRAWDECRRMADASVEREGEDDTAPIERAGI